MLDILNQEHFDQVMQFAETTNQLESLKNKLDYLSNYACSDEEPDKTKCLLGKDFAPYSFSFAMQRKDKETGEYVYWFNGGMIYFGANESGAGDPQFTVRIGDTSKSGWSIHT